MTTGPRPFHMTNSEVIIDELMQGIREEVRRRRAQDAKHASEANPAGQAPTPANGNVVDEVLAAAQEVHGVGLSLPPMTRQRGIKRKLAIVIARLFLRVAQIITRDQRVFNNASLAALRALHGGLKGQAARVAELGARTEGLEQALRAAREERIERIITETLRAGDHWAGPRGKEGLWFNEPILVQYDDRGRASWSGTSERIIEKAWVIRHLSSVATGSRILDVGCSESLLSLELASNGFLVTGVDIRPNPLGHPNFEFIQADICNSKLKSESYDAVIALSTIEHIGLGWYGDPVADSLDYSVLKEIYRLLKPAGRLLLTVPFGQRAVTPLHRIYDRVSLSAVIRDFTIEKIDYAVKLDARTWLSPIPEEEASQQKHDPVSYAPSAVAMVACLKPFTLLNVGDTNC